jgi:hypothetical protein
MASSRLRTALALPLTLALLVCIHVDALAWAKAGHRVVATLALSLLTPEARSQVTDLLGPDVTLVEIAAAPSWLSFSRSSQIVPPPKRNTTPSRRSVTGSRSG